MKPYEAADVSLRVFRVVCVLEEAGRAVGSPGFRKELWGCIVPIKHETLMAVCQLAGISAAALILPCALIDLEFDTNFLAC